jgi:glycosyltransferase involved in cell wall biosynthesis
LRTALASPLHIVLLDYRDITHPLAGGAEAYFNEIFQRVATYGHRVTLIAAKYRGARSEDRVGHLRVLRTGNKATFNVAGPRRALRLARQEPVDLFVENICKIPLLLPALTRIPVLPIVHHLFGTTLFHEVNPAFAVYVWLYEYLIPVVYRGLRFVAVSQSTADDLRGRGVRSPQIDIVYNGIDLRRYQGISPSPRPEPLFVYVGMLKRYKGLDRPIRAFAQVRTVVPDARFVLAGKGNDRPRLERLVRSLGLSDSVTFAGWLSEEAKVDVLRRASALVYPSLKEGWGISTLEAGACGTPTLASDTEGLRDAVMHGKTGFLVPHDDPAAWARCMITMLTDAALRARLGAAARRWAQGFGWDAQAKAMCAIVEEVAARRLSAPVGPVQAPREQRAE